MTPLLRRYLKIWKVCGKVRKFLTRLTLVFATSATNHPLVSAVVALLAMIIITQPGEHTIFEFTRELIEK
jgi:hypothetical protein